MPSPQKSEATSSLQARGRNPPNSAGFSGCRAIDCTPPERLQSRDNVRLDRAPVRGVERQAGQHVAIAYLLDRVIHRGQSAVDRRQLEPAIALTKALCESIQHLVKLHF
jgi:hypothetical protein